MIPSGQRNRRPSPHSPLRQRKKAWRRRARKRRLLLELLEDRTLLTVSISGTVFNDLNSNHMRDGAEPGLGGTTVFLDQNHDGVFDSNDVTVAPKSVATSNSDPLSFGVSASAPLAVSGLPNNIAHLRVSLDVTNASSDRILIALFSPTGIAPSGKIVAQDGNGPNLIFLGAGQHFVGTFDDQAATPITLAQPPFGKITDTYRPFNPFTDPGSHIYDGSPDGNWYLFFIDGKTGTVSNVTLNSWSLTFSVPETAVQTDANGNYAFKDLPAGNYDVGLVLPSADVQTLPASNATQSAKVTAGQTTSGVNFGVHAAPDLAGVAFQVTTPATDWGQSVTIRYTITNQGAGDAGPFDVQLRLSADGSIDNDPGDPVLDTLNIPGLAAFTSTSGNLTIQLPGAAGAPPAGFGGLNSTFLGFVIDPSNTVAETDKSNNSNQGQGIDVSVVEPLPNQAITSGGVHQQPSIAVDPTNPSNLVVAYMDYTIGKDGYAGIGVATSHDAGNTWTTGSIPLPTGFDEAAGYPVVHFDDQGHVFVSFMAVTFLGPKPPLIYPRGQDPNSTANPKAQFTSYEFQANNGIFVARSDDFGAHWNTPVAVVSHLYSGQPVIAESIPDLAVDTFKTLPDGRANPNHDNLYITWTRAARLNATLGISVVKFAVSHDGGATWTSVKTMPAAGNSKTAAAGNGSVNFSHLSIGPEGDVYLSLFDGGSFDVFHSTDGGATFRAPVFDPNTGEQNGIPFGFLSAFPNNTLLADQFRTLPVRAIAADPTHPGTVYAVEAIQVTNSGKLIDAADINFAVSHDYGQTWEEVFTVGPNTPNISDVPMDLRQNYHSVLNDDDGGRFLDLVKLNNEVTSGQALPHLSVDGHGNVSVIWYDTRRDAANHNLEVFGVTSTDGGQHFSANYRVTDTSFDANAGAFTDAIGQQDFFLGDAIGLVTANDTGYAVWTDTRRNTGGQTSKQDIFFARYPIVPAPAPPDDHFDPNNSPSAAIDLGNISVRRVFPRLTAVPGVDDWFKATTSASGDLNVGITGVPAGQRLLLQLYDSGGTTLLATGSDVLNANGQVVGEQLAFPSNAGQTYLVHVGGVPFGATVRVPYALVLQSLTGDLGTQVHGIQAGNLANAGDAAIYRLTVPVTGTLQVKLTAPNNTFTKDRFYLQILSPDGTTVLAVASFSGARGPGQKALVSLPVTAGQVVLISVSSFPPNFNINAQGPFQLEFTNLDQFQTPNPQTLFFPTHGDPSVIQAADLNGDGKPDLVAASTNFDDAVSVLINNGNGTFQGARGYDVGPGSAPGLRYLTVGNYNSDKIPDLAVSNYASGDVSILLGNGDGTFQPQRRFNGAPQGDWLAQGDFNGDGITDLVVLQHDFNGNGAGLAVLLGRGDGTFLPPTRLTTSFTDGAAPVLVGDINHDGHQDIVAFSFNSAEIDVFLGNGDGTFQPAEHFQTTENVAAATLVDLNGDGKLDIITSGTVDGIVSVLMNNGDGTFQPPKTSGVPNIGGVATTIAGFVVGDFGNFLGNGLDGHKDLVAIARPRLGTNLPELVVFPELVDAGGRFTGYGTPQVLTAGQFLGPLAFGDLTGRGETDIAAAVPGGVLVLYGNPPALVVNNVPQNARNLGTLVHQVVQTATIVPSQEDAYFKLVVPTEAVAGAGAEVIDFSGLFRYQAGAGISMEVRDGAGNLLGSGERFRVQAAQGEVLILHVFGLTAADGTRGVGAYTLDIDVLPQVVSVQAESLIPGGPVTSLVITLQGDRLDPATAEFAGNYHVFALGPNGVVAPNAGQQIALDAAGAAVTYNPGANLDVASGLTYATAARQTITLLFAQPLPAGTYRIEVAPEILAAPLSTDEETFVTPNLALGSHGLVSIQNGQVTNGVSLAAPNLVPLPGSAGDLASFNSGTAFLTQLHDDLGRLLDTGLTKQGDTQAITTSVTDQIQTRFDPGLGAAGDRPTSVLVLWLDPVSIDLADPQGKRAVYDLKTNAVSNQLNRTYVEVGGNIEVLVLADVAGTFKLNVADIPPSARGGALLLSQNGDQTVTLTDSLRAGIDSFVFDFPSPPPPPTKPTPPGGPPLTPTPESPLAAAFLIGLTTAPIVLSSTSQGTSSTASGPGGVGALLSFAASTFLAGATGSGTAVSLATVEQFFRDFADRVGDRLNVLAGEVGNHGQLLVNSGLRAIQAPAQAILSALDAMGLPDIAMPAAPLQEIGNEILRAIVPAVRAAGSAMLKGPNGAMLKGPNGQKPGPPAPPMGPDLQKNLPKQEEDDSPLENGDGFIAPTGDLPETQDALLASALLVSGFYHTRLEDSSRAREEDSESRRKRSKGQEG